MKKGYQTVITPKKGVGLNFKELIRYRELISLFVRKEFKTKYAQTVLGPLWFIIQPLLSTIVYTFVFGQIAKLSTDGVPQFLFYLAGNIPWIYFSSCIQKTSNVFGANSRLFGKVYFPRLVIPVSTVITCMINFLISVLLFAIVWVIYLITGANITLTYIALLSPLLILLLGILGMGIGLIISSVTVRFRDLQVLVGFGISLLMYTTPVVFSSKILDGGVYKFIMLNPASPTIEFLRYGFLGSGTLPWGYLGISAGVTLLVFLSGVTLFNRVSKNFVDIV